MTGDAIVLWVSMVARKGTAPAMRQAIETVAAISRSEEGCQIYQLLEDPREPERFRLLERWRDRKTFEAHQKSAHLADGFKRMAALQAEAPTFERWQAID